MLNDASALDEPNASAANLGRVGPDDFDRDVWCVLGLPFDRANVASAAATVAAAAQTGRRLAFTTPNTNALVRAVADPATRARIVDADLSLADGAPVVAIARLLGVPLPGRAAGADLFEALRARPAVAGRRLRVFFFGGREGAAEKAAAALNAGGGGVEAVGHYNPGFGDVASMSRPDIIDAINAARPDFILVSLGAAKGEAWIAHNLNALDAPVVAHLGAVVDFVAGTIRRAPRWVSSAGLEWLWRIKEERSLMSRYLADAAALPHALMSRALPQLGILRGRKSGAPADASIAFAAREVVVSLSGDLVSGDFGPIRRAFRAAAAARKTVILDFTGAGAVDLAFLGLVLMLEKASRRNGTALFVRGAAPTLRRLLAANGMDYSEATSNEAFQTERKGAAA